MREKMCLERFSYCYKYMQYMHKAIYLYFLFYSVTFKYHNTFPLMLITNIHRFVIEDKSFTILMF
jgi:hypothetical protein